MPRILIVDDDQGTQQMFKDILLLEGHEVDVAATGRDAIALISRVRPDLIILDNRLPDIPGMQVLREVCQSDPTARIVIVTGYADVEQSRLAFKWGALDFIPKPLYGRGLLQVVEESLSGIPVVQRRIANPGESGYLDALPSIGPAAIRWALLEVPVVIADEDTPTQDAWCRVAAHSKSTIKSRCAAVHVTPGDSLDFARLYRIVIRYPDQEWDLLGLLDVADMKTVKRLVLERAGLSAEFLRCRPSLEPFLRSQRLITSQTLILAIQEQLVHG